MAEFIKSNLFSIVPAIGENARLPAFHPPTANNVLSSLFLFFRSLNLSYLYSKRTITEKLHVNMQINRDKLKIATRKLDVTLPIFTSH